MSAAEDITKGIVSGLAGVAFGALLQPKTKEQLAKEALGVLLDAVPREELIGYLTPEGAQRAEFLADMAERAKFGGP